MRILISLIISTAIAFAAQEASIDLSAPDYVDEMPEVEFLPEMKRSGSLFGSGERPLFADRRAMKPNDLITVVISNTGSASFSKNKNFNGNSGGGNITPPNIVYNGDDEAQRQAAEALNNQSNFTLNKGVKTSNFNSGGSLSRSENLNATLTARVIKVLENGNYFIYGHREILVDGEKQVLSLSGVVRPYDIGRDNVVQSRHIADAKISYVSDGAMNLGEAGPASKAIENMWQF